MALLQLHCPAGAPLRCAVCHTFSSSFLRSGSFCVLYATSFISSFVPLHCTRSQLCILLQVMASRPTASQQYRRDAHASSQSQRYSTHRVPLCSTTSSIHFSRIQSTRCLLLLCSPCGHRLRCGASLAHSCAYKADALCHTIPLHCASIVPAAAGSLLSAPAGGTRRQFRRASSIALTASSLAPVWASVPHQLSFLWPQALLPYTINLPVWQQAVR